MVTLISENLSHIEKKHGLKPEELTSLDQDFEKYLQKIDDRNQGFYKVIDDECVVNKINDFELETRGKYSHVVVLGIGGSALGTLCLKESLKHLFEDQLPNSSTPRLHVIDNIDPALIKDLEDIIDYPKTLFIVVTKSGGTVETATQYFYFKEKTKALSLDPKDHFVVITGPHSSFLRETAEKENLTTFEVPEDVGGRFSVLTNVGLLPAKLIGIDIERLLTGAKEMRDKFLKKNPEENTPFQLAKIQYLLEKKGKTINVLMPYSQRLFRFADWYRQLLAESIGKKFDNNKNEVFTGITPVNALGVTDQHSQLQLYSEGPNDKLFIFIELKRPEPEITIPNSYPDNPEFDFLNKPHTFGELLNIEKRATEQSLTKNDRPNVTILVDSLREESLGELFMLFEGATAFLGEMYGINAFDQPGVELSKKLTKEALLK